MGRRKFSREIRKCLICSTKFKCRIDSSKKFCCHKCYWISMKNIPNIHNQNGKYIPCQVCNTLFYKTKKSKRRFCCRECYLIDHSKNVQNIKCEICSRIFRTGNQNTKFCSRKCYLEYHKQIMKEKICPICNKIFLVPANFSEVNKTCSLECARVYITTSKKRVENIGKTLKKLYQSGKRKSWNKGKTKKDNKSLKQMSINKIERYTSGDPVIWNKGKRFTKEESEKHSKRISQLYIDGKMKNVGRGKSGYFFSKKNNKKLYYRSSYELIAYKLLEQLSKVKSYENEPFRIQYEYQKINRYTIPDILITYTDNTKELVEVKPKYKLLDKQTEVKLNVMEDYAFNNNWKFSVWTEKELNIN